MKNVHNFSLEYYQKGHGNSKIYLGNEDDMDTMCSQSAEAQEIQLWCNDRCDNKKRHEKHTN